MSRFWAPAQPLSGARFATCTLQSQPGPPLHRGLEFEPACFDQPSLFTLLPAQLFVFDQQA